MGGVPPYLVSCRAQRRAVVVAENGGIRIRQPKDHVSEKYGCESIRTIQQSIIIDDGEEGKNSRRSIFISRQAFCVLQKQVLSASSFHSFGSREYTHVVRVFHSCHC